MLLFYLKDIKIDNIQLSTLTLRQVQSHHSPTKEARE